MKIVLAGVWEVCIVVVMRLTKNTNKKIRSYVNNVLNHFDLVRGDNTCYRELYEAIDTARYYTKPSREEFIETMCEAYGCMTKSQAEAKRRLVGGGLMGQIESFLDTL